jgi:Rod binding domain-containing protein
MDVPASKATGVAPAPLRAETKVPDETKESARKFEAMFLSQVVEEMIKTVDVGDYGGGEAEEKWRSFLASAVADQIALQGGTGIAQTIETAIDSYKSAQAQGGK